MKRQILFFAIPILMWAISMTGCQVQVPGDAAVNPLKQHAKIDPDYQNIVIPPNIAPLNFRIQEQGERFIAKLSGNDGTEIVLESTDGTFQIPIKKWKTLLDRNRSDFYTVTLYSKQSKDKWLQFEEFRNEIAAEDIDSYLAYRLINPAYNYWNKMGLYQRNLETFKETPILVNSLTDDNCMNCHNFNQGDPNNMVFHMRAGKGSGTYIRYKGEWQKTSLKTDFNRGGAYPAWHPNGDLIAFSVNSLTMFYHSRGETRDVLDRESNLVVYDVANNMITASPSIANEDKMETFPHWSPDGKYLYFCSAPNLQNYISENGRDLDWENIHYDLYRAAFDANTQEWGPAELLLSADDLGKSTVIPRVSPDGRYVMICLANYGSFPIYHDHSDLYLFDVESRSLEPLDTVNDPEVTESYHCWSTNGSWFAFTSKRRDGFHGRPFFAYFKDGKAYKPFVLPQQDPSFYDKFLINYNVPELFTEKIDTRPQELVRVAYDNSKLVQARLDPKIKVRNKAGDEPMESIYQSKPN